MQPGLSSMHTRCTAMTWTTPPRQGKDYEYDYKSFGDVKNNSKVGCPTYKQSQPSYHINHLQFKTEKIVVILRAWEGNMNGTMKRVFIMEDEIHTRELLCLVVEDIQNSSSQQFKEACVMLAWITDQRSAWGLKILMKYFKKTQGFR